MAKIDIYIPAMGEGIIEATITKWFKKEGDNIEHDESIVEIATDKVDSEIPAPVSGVIEKILFEEGVTVKVGEVIAIITNEAPETVDVNIHTEELTVDKVKLEELENIYKESANINVSNVTSLGKFLSPLVRSIITKENIPVEEIDKIKGSGYDGRITKDDIINYINNKETSHIPIEKPAEIVEPIVIHDAHLTGNTTIIEMERLRRLTAEHVLKSKQISPHVTSFIEADVTNIVNWREKIKSHFFEKNNEKITFTPIFIEAVAKALKDYPMINVSVDGTNIIVKNFINIGLATNLPSGNLIVPVIKNADKLSITELTKAVNDLAKRARENHLNPDEIKNGTFTITNLGTFGTLAGTPIINQPEVAILGIGAITKKPVVIETESGDAIAIRQMCMLSLSFDHRVVDGYMAGMFMKKIVEYLEKFDFNHTY